MAGWSPQRREGVEIKSGERGATQDKTTPARRKGMRGGRKKEMEMMMEGEEEEEEV
ncbi:hypothetical protein FOCG_08537 [Fusarium oxysporum f. sp. radicis-lycopersici 26381]|uniref:Uncharacterized protein n=1 Tax=Fusarium oxysporum f. sp. lycopersici (strain 4287 / CBS 123668 / FGSC 9935 / NRRL 34936) TaxID=426428 RepID=A0A0J9W0Z6_FUSO4|nr:hypothetical protein FOXG_21684 [Fusarium oxysporum f. sp. lycopersici 4287]EXL52774.1 hypothetical protein FOCG_08537 [Fusarium oxysporum f. sp. radicis-lycopersici 26381]KNB16495.1 hypothetical protein FOXG_21684 [Fusarium oxysporum f. sp. lycopersici 4287]